MKATFCWLLMMVHRLCVRLYIGHFTRGKYNRIVAPQFTCYGWRFDKWFKCIARTYTHTHTRTDNLLISVPRYILTPLLFQNGHWLLLPRDIPFLQVEIVEEIRPKTFENEIRNQPNGMWHWFVFSVIHVFFGRYHFLLDREVNADKVWNVFL